VLNNTNVAISQQKTNLLASEEVKYDFKKTAKQDVSESRHNAVWDPTGRYLAIYGVKRSHIDKQEKSIKFYSIFGEPINNYEKIPNLQLFKWRPRPSILKASEVAKLKKEYKVKYAKKFKEEEQKDKKEVNDVVKVAKKKIRDEFLENFFLPLRRDFEQQRPAFEKLWPLKASDFLEHTVEFEAIYSYDNVVSEKKV
jgi:hypothetical protein